MIRDISDLGAKLYFTGSASMPDRFNLVMPHKGVTRRAHVVWSRGGEMGVRFERISQPVPSSVSATDALRERIRELEDEVARLESRLYQLTEGA